MNIKELFKNKMNLLSEDKEPTHLEMFKHHKNLEASKWQEVNNLVTQRDEINKQYIQAIKSGDKDVAEELKKKFYDLDDKAVKTANAARGHSSIASDYHLAAQKSPDYKPEDFDYKPTSKSIEKSESIQKEGLHDVKPTNTDNINKDNLKAKQEPTTDDNDKIDQSKPEPSAFDHTREQTKAPTEFKKAKPIEDEPKADTSEVKGKNFEIGKEPSVLKGAKSAKEVDVETKSTEPKNSETQSTKTAEPNHPNIAKPVDTQPAQQSVQPQVQNQPVDNIRLTGGVKQLDQSNPLNKPQIGNQQVAQQPVQPQPVQPALVNPHPSTPGTISPTSAPQPAQGLNINGAQYGSGAYKLDQSNSLNGANFGHNGGLNTSITTNQPSVIPSSGQIVNSAQQPVSNPVDHWANFKQSAHDTYGHLKNFAGQQYHNIKNNLGQHYQNIKQNASEHLAHAKQFATDHAHEIAGAGALGAAGLAAYAAYKHFKNKKKQQAPQPH